MAKIIKLPSGNTVTIKEATEYSLKDRKFVLKDLKTDDLDNVSNMMDVLEKVIVVSVTDWSFDLIPPHVKQDSLDTLSLADSDTLFKFAKDVLPDLMPQLDDKGDGEVDPKVITPDSND